MTLPDPDAIHPLPGVDRVVFLRPLLARTGDPANVEVGAFTYYDDPEHAEAFFERNLLYDFGASGARLGIGRFCAIATDARFMFPDANHVVTGLSTYPFGILGGAFAEALPLTEYPWRPAADTVVGHDVWIGTEALVMPGVRIGHGAVVGARGRHARRARLRRRRRQPRAHSAPPPP